MIQQINKQADEWHAFPSCLPPGIQLAGDEEEPEEEATLGSRLMSLLEKVRLVKKKEEKSEEESPAEERKPREHWGHQGKTGVGQAALCLGSFWVQDRPQEWHEGWVSGINERGGAERGVREEACWGCGPNAGAAQCVCWNSVAQDCQRGATPPT